MRFRERALAVAVGAFLVALPTAADGIDNAREAKRFQETKWTLLRTLKDVDPEVVRSLKARFGRDDRLADRGEPFEPSEELTRRPGRRFLLGGRAGKRWFVAYEKGGRTPQVVLTVVEAEPIPRVLLLARGRAGSQQDGADWEVELEDLRAALRERRLFLEEPTSPYY